MNKRRYITELDALLIVFMVALVILSVPHIMRYISHDSVLIGQDSYYNARIAESGITREDPLIFGSRPYIFNLYPLILSGFSYLFPIDFSSKLIPFLFGILSALLFYLMLKELRVDLRYRTLISLILVSSPVFIYTFTVSNPLAALIFLDLVGFYLLLKEKKIYFVPAAIVFTAAMLFDFLNAMITLILLLSFVLIKPKKMSYKATSLLLIFLIMVCVFQYSSIYLKYGVPQKPTFIKKNFVKELVSDFGSNGFSLFTVLLAVLGIIITWKNKYRFMIGYTALLILLILLFHSDTTIYLGFILSVLASHAFIALIRMKWEVKQIKNLTIFILVLGLLFSTISYLGRIADFPPHKPVVESLNWLNAYSRPGQVVFSHYSKGFWIQKVAGLPVVMDGNFNYIDANQRFNDSNELFYSRNLEKTKLLLDKYSVSYIFIDKDMKTGQVWTREEQGLLFLFRNSETFKKIYDTPEVEVWEYLKEGKAE